MKPIPSLCLALAVLALSACKDPAPTQPPPDPPHDFNEVLANFGIGTGTGTGVGAGRVPVPGPCRYVNVLANAAHEAGVDVERAGPIVSAAIEGLSHDLPCGLVEEHAVDALIAAASRDPSLRQRRPSSLTTAIEWVRRAGARYAAQLCSRSPRYC